MWFAQACANIALIKYMGKKDAASNIPANPSLSYTLPHLVSTVKIESVSGKHDVWEPLNIPGAIEFSLSEQAQKRFLDHLQRVKAHFGFDGGFLVQSSNNFPHSTGLASSASSFAALTKCAVLAISELTDKPMPSLIEQANLSRLGSGSSCRSFFSPWALWTETEVKAVDLPYKDLIHRVVIVSSAEKKVSSSEAHRRVSTSKQYVARSERAEENLKVLVNALVSQDWKDAYTVCWREFQDMHRLFATCDQPFSYMTENGLALLNTLQDCWEAQQDGPLVTMDAGPNIHLLYRPDQADLAERFKQQYLVGNFDVL